MQSSPSTHRIELASGRTLTARVRPGQGVPVVFLHGLFSSSETWTAVASQLDRPSIAFDLPGVATRAEDVAEAIRKLGLERFELVGHSFGGKVAARLAELLPERVESLLLLAPAGFGRLATAFRSPAGYAGSVTAVLGLRDRVVPASHAAGLSRSYPAAQVLLWESAGHHLQADRREALLELIATGRVAHGSRRARRRLRRHLFPVPPLRTRVRFA
jgi:pimeloyl-ACP methyl ester carboxylesterase